MPQLNVNSAVSIPVANPIPLRRVDISLEDFDNKMHFSDRIGTEPNRYYQPWVKSETFTYKFYTNFEANTAEIIDCLNQTVAQTPTVSKLKTHRGKFLYSDCKVASIGVNYFVYFENGNTYTDANFDTVLNSYDLDGRVPNLFIDPGDAVRLKIDVGGTLTSFKVGTVSSLEWVPDLSAHGYKLDITAGSTIETLDGFVEIEYDEKPYDLYGFPFDLSGLADGRYYVKLTATTSVNTIEFNSEPIDLVTSDDKTLKIRYTHTGEFNTSDEHGYPYETDEYNLIRIPAAFYELDPSGEIDQYEDDSARLTQQRAVPYRAIRLQSTGLKPMPFWMADKLNMILAHDTKEIYGKKWQQEDFGDSEPIDFTDLTTVSILLRQVDDRRFNEQDVSAMIEAEFTPNEFTSLDKDGEVVNSAFASNLTSNFSLKSKPAWISLDKSNILDSESLQITASANPNQTPRSGVIIFNSDIFPQLEASIDVDQVKQPPTDPMEYLDVEPTNVEIPADGEDSVIVIVESSGSYSVSGDYTTHFDIVIGSGGIGISAKSANNDGVARTGTLTLTLDSNPAITVDVIINQESQELSGTISVSPDTLNMQAQGESKLVTVTADTGNPSWQVSNPGFSWISVTPGSGSGTLTLTVSTNSNSGGSRSGYFNVKNLSNGVNHRVDVLQSGTSGDEGPIPEQP